MTPTPEARAARLRDAFGRATGTRGIDCWLAVLAEADRNPSPEVARVVEAWDELMAVWCPPVIGEGAMRLRQLEVAINAVRALPAPEQPGPRTEARGLVVEVGGISKVHRVIGLDAEGNLTEGRVMSVNARAPEPQATRDARIADAAKRVAAALDELINRTNNIGKTASLNLLAAGLVALVKSGEQP